MTEPDHRGHTYIDLTSPEYAARFASSEAREYRKTATVKARILTEDTPVATVLADGTRETERVAPAGQWLVENPGGEQYAVEPAEFEARYGPTSEPGVYQAKGRIRALANTTGGPVWINAPWGEPQYGAADCGFACLIRPDGSLDLAKPYIIARAELNQTYTAVPAEGGPAVTDPAPLKFITTGQLRPHEPANTVAGRGEAQRRTQSRTKPERKPPTR
ncbi:PGDYG domain-containing protein [Kribbella sp. NPDC048915]|uniref:PGDYG domain-containing protein n=1 Tax=Kribbella sp. NPDC048915 TaxID=3155148 RepID=UPI0033CFC42A